MTKDQDKVVNMALKEGRCVNCGSLLILDPKMEKGQCLFCGAVFLNEDAFAAMQLPGDHEFPNEEQPEYTGPPLVVQPVRDAVFAPQVTQRRVKGRKVDEFVLPQLDIPDFKMSAKSRILITSVIAGLLVIFLAVAFLLSLKRDGERAEIKEHFVADLEHELSGIAIEQMKSDAVIVVLKNSVSEQQAAEIFLDYAKARAEVIGYDENDFSASANSITMRIATPEGGFLITEPAEPADLVLDRAMTKLD
jgi:hypothetical protein